MGGPLILFLAASHGMWDFSSQTRGGTSVPCSGSTEEVPREVPQFQVFREKCTESTVFPLPLPSPQFPL